MEKLSNSVLTSEEYCDPFDEKYNYWMRVEHLGRYFFAKDNIDKNGKVLDIACCNGYGTKVLSECCNQITGMDANKKYIEIANKNNNGNNIKYIVINTDYDDIFGTYDYITCFETIEHVRYPDLLLKKLYNALNENGKMFLSVPNSKYEVIENNKNKDIYHLHIFEYNELINLFQKNGLKVIKVLGQNQTNKIVNKKIKSVEKNGVINDAMSIGYPNEQDINETYSYIFILEK